MSTKWGMVSSGRPEAAANLLKTSFLKASSGAKGGILGRISFKKGTIFLRKSSGDTEGWAFVIVAVRC